MLINGGNIQPASPFDISETSCGQFAINNATRSWTVIWLMLEALGWRPGAPPSRFSLPVRVSFRSGTGSYLLRLISNPRFYELLMGWPIGWSAPEGPVTGFAVWLQRSRGQLSNLLSSRMVAADV